MPMKKLVLFAALFILVSGIFAEPRIPFDNTEEPYVYVSNDFSSVYEISIRKFSGEKFYSVLRFKKTSIINSSEIILNICFITEKLQDNFITNIHLSNLENEFSQIQKTLIDNNAYMRILNRDPYKILYEIDSSTIE